MNDNEVKQQKIEDMYQHSKRLFPEVPEVTPAELVQISEERRVVVVDVRTPVEQSVSMIADAVTSQEFEAHPDRYSGATVVAYCTVGHRSGLYAKRLQAEGWTVFNLQGAILSWTHAGGELRDTGGGTQRVHVSSPQCDLAADGYEAVW